MLNPTYLKQIESELAENKIVCITAPATMSGQNFNVGNTLGATGIFQHEFFISGDYSDRTLEHLLKNTMLRLENDTTLQTALARNESLVFTASDGLKTYPLILQKVTMSIESANQLFSTLMLIRTKNNIQELDTIELIGVYITLDKKSPLIRPGQLVLRKSE
jgi:hypothetical protein